MKRPILYIVIPFCFGIAISRFLKIPIAYPVILSAVFIALAILSIGYGRRGLNLVYISEANRDILSHVLLYLAVFFFGIAAYQNSMQLPADHISRYVQDMPQKIFVRGVVSDDPITSPALYGKKKTAFVLRADAIGRRAGLNLPYGWYSASGLVKVSAYSDKGAEISFGEELVMEGLLSEPHGLKNPGVFDYEEYLAVKDIHATLRVKEDFLIKKLNDRSGGLNLRYGYVQKTAYKLRHAIRNLFDKYLVPPYSGFMKAILIGDRTGLDENLKDDFVKTGTVHILAISGLHVGLIAALVLAFFGILGLPKRLNLTLTLLFLIFYSFVAGSNPPIIRATIMFAVFVIGYLINRETDTLNSISLAAFLILLANPKELFDPSFQLSFASVTSIIIFAPKIDKLFGLDEIKKNSMGRRTVSYIYKGISVSIAAWLGTWPVILSYFNIISPVSIIANLVVIPLLFVLMAVSSVFIFACLLSNFLGALAGQLLCTLAHILFIANRFFSNIPFSYFRAPSPSPAFFVLYYALVSLLFFPPAVEFRQVKIRRGDILLAILLFFNILAWKENINFKNEILKITFLDVGQGDSIFIELPGKGNILLDGGSGGEAGKYDAGKSAVAPYLWNRGVRSIDAVIVTHFHADHLGGLIYILKNFNVGCVIDSGVSIAGSAMYNEYKKTLKRGRIRHFAVGEGDVIGPASGVEFFVLNPSKNNDLSGALSEENDNSIVLKLVYKNFSCMLCGDATSASMSRLISHRSFLKSDVIKIPHHGGGLGDEKIVSNFFTQVSPKICVTSRGSMSRRGLQSAERINFITSLNSTSYETNKSGAITILANGKSSYIAKAYISKN